MKYNLNKMKGINNESEFDHKYAAWANNHNGWSKAKKKEFSSGKSTTQTSD